MSEETATLEVSAEIRELGDKIAELSLKDAKALSDYLKEEYNIEPAAGGAVMVAGGGGDGGGEAAVEQTEFDVILTGFGDSKLPVVKVVKGILGNSLMEAKKMVEGAPSPIKEGVEKEEAEKIKAEIEEAGGSVEIK